MGRAVVGGQQDRVAGGAGLSVCAAVAVVRRSRRFRDVLRDGLSARAANISSSPRCVSVPSAEAKAFRRAHRGTVFVAGMFIAGFVSIPIVNLATPLFAMAFMVHLHKQLFARAAERTRAGSEIHVALCWLSRSAASSTVLPGHLHRSAIRHCSHSGLRATQT